MNMLLLYLIFPVLIFGVIIRKTCVFASLVLALIRLGQTKQCYFCISGSSVDKIGWNDANQEDIFRPLLRVDCVRQALRTGNSNIFDFLNFQMIFKLLFSWIEIILFKIRIRNLKTHTDSQRKSAKLLFHVL